MKIINRTLILLLFIFAADAQGAFVGPDGKLIPDTEFRKSNGDFGAQLIITHKEKEALERWNIPSKGVYISTTDKIQKGKIITALIVFKGCAKTNDGNCRLTYKMNIVQPDGKVYADLPTDEIWYDKPASVGHTLGLSVGYVRLIVETHEQVGKYTFTAKVKDHVSGKKLSLTNTINVHE